MNGPTLPPQIHLGRVRADHALGRAYLLVHVNGVPILLDTFSEAGPAWTKLDRRQHPEPDRAFDLRVWSTRAGRYMERTK